MSAPPASTWSSPLAFCVLASGSAGNCTAVFVQDRSAENGESRGARRACFLIDAGISPRRTDRLLYSLGMTLADVTAIILTHLDADHFYHGWVRFLAKRAAAGSPLRLHIHRRHRNQAWRGGLTAREVSLFEEHVDLPCEARAEPMLLAHDDVGSVGFVIEHAGHRLGFATDLGAVPRTLLKRFVNLHALALESNYDRQMQEESGRPVFLKRRITGGMGHLSNEQAIEAVREIERQSRLSHIALLHLSEECNCPEHLARLWRREMPHAMPRLTITNQRQPTALLHVVRPALQVEVKQQLLFQAAC